MVSSAIWKKKHARVSSSKTIKIAPVRRTSALSLEKLTSVCFFQIARENILLFINNIDEKLYRSEFMFTSMHETHAK